MKETDRRTVTLSGEGGGGGGGKNFKLTGEY